MADRIRLILRIECCTSSEYMGAVSGDESRPLLECSRVEVVEAVSEMVSLLEVGLLRRRRSST